MNAFFNFEYFFAEDIILEDGVEMSKTKQLVIAILRFLDDQVNDPDVEDSACESIVGEWKFICMSWIKQLLLYNYIILR